MARLIVGIDPGSEFSGVCFYGYEQTDQEPRLLAPGVHISNQLLASRLARWSAKAWGLPSWVRPWETELAIETVTRGASPLLFYTSQWAGAFWGIWTAGGLLAPERVDRSWRKTRPRKVQMFTRANICGFLLGGAMFRSGNRDRLVRAALIERLGPKGTKENPGPTYHIHGNSHGWAALAVAYTAMYAPERAHPWPNVHYKKRKGKRHGQVYEGAASGGPEGGAVEGNEEGQLSDGGQDPRGEGPAVRGA